MAAEPADMPHPEQAGLAAASSVGGSIVPAGQGAAMSAGQPGESSAGLNTASAPGQPAAGGGQPATAVSGQLASIAAGQGDASAFGRVDASASGQAAAAAPGQLAAPAAGRDDAAQALAEGQGDAAQTQDDATGSVLGDPRFFERAGPFSLDDLLGVAGGRLERAERVAGAVLVGVAALQTAAPNQVAVLHNPKYGVVAGRSRAGVVIVSEALAARVPHSCAALVVADPHLAWAQVGRLFHPSAAAVPGIHPTAVVDPTAEVDATAGIGPYAVVGPRVVVGSGCQVGPHAVVQAGVVMGPGCRIGAGATVSHALLGARVYVYPGARVGQEGFGFAITAHGFVSVPQLGRVILHDDVEIGANTTVDRGASHDTVIGAGSRIDNLVQIGHNVRMGRGCVMAGQSGIAGSCTLEDFVQLGAQAGLAGHLTVGAKARIGAQAGVMADVPAGSDVIGSPALPIREFFRNVAVLRRLARRGPAGGDTTGAREGGAAASAQARTTEPTTGAAAHPNGPDEPEPPMGDGVVGEQKVAG